MPVSYIPKSKLSNVRILIHTCVDNVRVHASIVELMARFAPLKSWEEGHSEMREFKFFTPAPT